MILIYTIAISMIPFLFFPSDWLVQLLLGYFISGYLPRYTRRDVLEQNFD